MRASVLLSVLLLPFSAFATPLPFDVINTYQRRAVPEPLLESPVKGPEDTAAASSSRPAPGSEDAEAPLLPGPRGNVPVEPPRTPLGTVITWFQRKFQDWLDKFRINHVYAQVWIDEFKEEWARLTQGRDLGAPEPTYEEFMAKMSAKNREIREADNAVLVGNVLEFQTREAKKAEDFANAQRLKAQDGQLDDAQLRIDAEAFKTAGDKEWKDFLRIQNAKLERNNERYMVVQQWIANGLPDNPAPTPPVGGTGQGSASTVSPGSRTGPGSASTDPPSS